MAETGPTDSASVAPADPVAAASSLPDIQPSAGVVPPDAGPGAASLETELDAAQASIDELLSQAMFEDPSMLATDPTAGSAPFNLPAFQQAMADVQVSNIDLLRDVELNVKIELGRSRMLVEDVLKLAEGSVVELDKLAGDPVDVFVNDRLVARGEVLVLNDNFCVRVNEIMAGAKEEGL